MDGGDLVAVPAAHLVPDAALRVQRSVLRADVVGEIAEDAQVGAGDGVQHHLDGLRGVHGVVVDALHGEQHPLLLTDGQDLAQAAEKGFLRFLAGDAGLLGHVGGLAAHAAGVQHFGDRDLAQHLGDLGAALVLVGIAQLDIGAVHRDGNTGSGGCGAGGLDQFRGDIGIALHALNGLGVGQLGAGKARLADGSEQLIRGVTAKIVPTGTDHKFRQGFLLLQRCVL